MSGPYSSIFRFRFSDSARKKYLGIEAVGTDTKAFGRKMSSVNMHLSLLLFLSLYDQSDGILMDT